MFSRLRFVRSFHHRRWRVAALCGCLLIAFLYEPSKLHAADRLDKLEQEASFHIEPGSLESALLQFSRQAGIQVVVGARVAAFSVAAINGRRNAREVLTTLLNDTGLKFAVVGETVTIFATDPKNHPINLGTVGDPQKSVPNTRNTGNPRTGNTESQ